MTPEPRVVACRGGWLYPGEPLAVCQDCLTELAEAVAQARARGVSWAMIGRVNGMTRQSAHERWAALAD